MKRLYTSRNLSAMLLAGFATFITSAASAQGIVISDGAQFVMNGSVQLNLNDAGITNNGTISPSTSTVIFSGNGATNPTIGGDNATDFHNLVVDRSEGLVVLGQNVNVSNQVIMTNGNLNLNNNVLDLDETGSLSGERENARIIGPNGGYIRAVALLNTPESANPGNLGMTITSEANLGVTEVRRSHTPYDVSTMDESINRYFSIIPTNNNNLNASLRMYYFEAELNGVTEEELQLWASTDDGADWTLYGVNSINTVENYAEMSGVDTLSYLTLSSNIVGDIPLSLNLVNFHGKLNEGKVLLNWNTQNEVGSSHFDVERSTNGTSFVKIGTVQAQGNSAGHAYQFIDAAPQNGINLYRLRIVDIDKHQSLSSVVSVQLDNAQGTHISEVYPNPAVSTINLKLYSNTKSTTELSIFNAAGILVSKVPVELTEGNQTITLAVGDLAQGMYFIRFNNSLAEVKFIKE
jgi:hypothetical protein